MAQPILYGPAYSTYARTARIALEEKGVGYKLEEVDVLKGAGQQPAHLARHPFGKVPTFEHDGLHLYETFAITRYVDEAFPGPALQPSDVRQRARMTQIVGVIDSYVYQPLVTHIAIQRLVVPMLGGKTDEAVVEGAVPAARKALGSLDKLMGSNSWLAGPDLTLADLHLAPIFAYFSQTPEGQRVLGEVPALRGWWERVSKRESFTRTAPKFG